MSLVKAEKWTMHRAGFFNHWFYKEQQYYFANGHLLFKGLNASGKSISMFSLLPLLLDGNHSPRRLDPMGKRSRKMAQLMRGEGMPKDEKTAYVWLEYRKGNEFITTGLGLHVPKESEEVRSWGFVMKGKRIGFDFHVYREEYNSEGVKGKVPLTEKQLQELISQEQLGYFAPSGNRDEYAKLVNAHIFKFETLDKFKELVKLLVHLNSPKLANPADFKPSSMCEILSESLPELPTVNLRSITEMIEEMDAKRGLLEKAKEEKGHAENLDAAYLLYNRAYAVEKAADFTTTLHYFREIKKVKEKLETKLQEKVAAEEENRQKLEDLNNKYAAINERVIHLRETGVLDWDKKLRLTKEKLDGKKLEVESKTEQAEKKKELERKLKVQIKELEDSIESLKRLEKEHIENLQSISEDICFMEHETWVEYFKNTGQKQGIAEAMDFWQSAAEGHRDLLSKVVDLCKQELEVKRQKEETEAKVLAGKQEEERLANKIQKLEEHLYSLIDVLKQQALEQLSTNLEFKLTPNQVASLLNNIDEIFETTTVADIHSSLGEVYQSLYGKLAKERAEAETNRERLEGKMADANSRLQKWINQTEPEIASRREETSRVRNELHQIGVPFLTFFEAVEFKEEVDQAVRGKLEEALAHMGVLDSLILPVEHNSKITSSDAYLVPVSLPKGTRTLSAVLEPVVKEEGVSVSGKDIVAILDSIALDKVEDFFFITEEGSYQYGLVRGFTTDSAEAIYIGAEARRKHRDKMIASIQVEIEGIEWDIEEAHSKLRRISEREGTLKQEKNAFPSFSEIEGCYASIMAENVRYSFVQNQNADLDTKLKNVLDHYRSIKKERTTLTCDMTGKTEDDFPLMLKDCKEYLDILRKLRDTAKDNSDNQKRVSEWQESLVLAAEDTDNANFDLQKAEGEKKQLEQEVITIEETIQKLTEDGGISYTESIAQLELIENEQKNVEKALNKLEVEKETLANDVAGKEVEMSSYEKLLQTRRNWFIQELDLKLVLDVSEDVYFEDNDLQEVAKRLLSMRGEEGYIPLHEAKESLITAYSEHGMRGLYPYSPLLEDMDFPMSIEQSDFASVSSFMMEWNRLQDAKKRKMVYLKYEGRRIAPQELLVKLVEQIDINELTLSQQEENLFKEIMFNQTGERIRKLTSRGVKWKEEINRLMEQQDSSNGLCFRLQWKPKDEKKQGELSTKKLLDLIQRDVQTLKEDDYKQLYKHFSDKFEHAKEKYLHDEKAKKMTLEDLIGEVIDYRNWFEFVLEYKKEGLEWAELTNEAFEGLSGGERAMSIYVPLFTAVHSRYLTGSPDAPHIITLDEAFAGVDEKNIGQMFKLMEELDFNYILTSQILWGDYEETKSLAIAEIIRPKNSTNVVAVHYKWDGNRRSPWLEVMDGGELTRPKASGEDIT